MLNSKSFHSGVGKMLQHVPAILLEADTIEAAIQETQLIMGQELCCHSNKKTGDKEVIRGIRCGYYTIMHMLSEIEREDGK